MGEKNGDGWVGQPGGTVTPCLVAGGGLEMKW